MAVTKKVTSKEVEPMPISDCLANLKNYQLDVVAVTMTVSMYNDASGGMDADQLRNALRIINDKCKELNKYSRQ